jgi:hypothetical protein
MIDRANPLKLGGRERVRTPEVILSGHEGGKPIVYFCWVEARAQSRALPGLSF